MGREVGELPAGAWTGFVDHAEIAIEEYASVFGMPQHVLPVLQIGDRVVPDDLLWQYIQVSRKSFNIFAGNVHPGIAATISANLAVDLLLHLLGQRSRPILAPRDCLTSLRCFFAVSRFSRAAAPGLVGGARLRPSPAVRHGRAGGWFGSN